MRSVHLIHEYIVFLKTLYLIKFQLGYSAVIFSRFIILRTKISYESVAEIKI